LKNLLIVIPFVCSNLFSFSQGKNLISEVKTNEIAKTSSAGFENSASKKSTAKVWDYNDSLKFIPAYDKYCSWNTKKIHAYSTEESLAKGTIEIPLIVTDSCFYVHPVNGRIVNSDFGWRRYREHLGIDLELETGDPVYSAFSGMVRIAQYSSSYGKVIVVRHQNGLETFYAHLSEINVIDGQWVKAGEIIGLGGNTGHSYGSHLHFEVRYLGEPLNPNDVIDFKNGVLKSDILVINTDIIKSTTTSAIAKTNQENLKAKKKSKYHTVRKGETLYSISKKYKTDVNSLCKINKISKKAKLFVGKKIKYA
jgi:Peptidase family M23/LysM domain